MGRLTAIFSARDAKASFISARARFQITRMREEKLLLPANIAGGIRMSPRPLGKLITVKVGLNKDRNSVEGPSHTNGSAGKNRAWEPYCLEY